MDPAACCKGKSSFLNYEQTSHEISFSFSWVRSEGLLISDLWLSQYGCIWALLRCLYTLFRAPSSAGFSSNLPQMVPPSYRVWLHSRKSRRTRWSTCLPRTESTESKFLQLRLTSYFLRHTTLCFLSHCRSAQPILNAVLCVSSATFDLVHPTSYSWLLPMTLGENNSALDLEAVICFNASTAWRSPALFVSCPALLDQRRVKCRSVWQHRIRQHVTCTPCAIIFGHV